MSDRFRSRPNEFCIGEDPNTDPSEAYNERMRQRQICGEFTVENIMNSEDSADYDLVEEVPPEHENTVQDFIKGAIEDTELR